MKRTILLTILIALTFLFIFSAQNAQATMYTIDMASNLTFPVGDYVAMAGTGGYAQAQTGNVLEVPSGGAVTSNTVPMSYIYDTLLAGGVTSTNLLVFGLDVNETGSAGSNFADWTMLTMSLTNTPYGTMTWEIDPDVLRLYNYNGSGNSSPEARVQVNLGFDFMDYYSTNAGNYIVTGQLANADDGFDSVFISSGYTLNPPIPPGPVVPEPTSMLLFSTGLVGAFLRKRIFC